MPHSATAAAASTRATEESPAGGTVRTYLLSADEVVWNYAPHGRNDITGKPFGVTENVFVRSGPGRIGSRYLKCLYRG